METNITIPSKNGTDIIVQGNQKGTQGEETSEMDFIDNFLSVLITNMNPSDLSLDAHTSEKLSKLINNDSIVNEDISKLDLKQFINSLKSELANGKPHQFSLKGMKETVSNLLSNQSNSLSTTPIINSNNHEESFTSIGLTEDKGEDSTEKLLLNLRKFLTKDEFENIKNNLQSSIAKKNVEVAPKVEAISRFISVITGKELEAKNKIVSKANDIQLTQSNAQEFESIKLVNQKTAPIIENLHSDISSESNNSQQRNINFNLAENLNIGSPKLDSEMNNVSTVVETKQGINPKNVEGQTIALENEIKGEQILQNGTNKNEEGLSKEFSKEFNRQQGKENLKHRIAKSDISELLSRTNTKKVELKKTENIVKSNFVEKAIKNIKMTKSGGSNVARIMLNPRSLGDITLRISMIGNNVKLYIKADKSEAAEHIDRQLPLLKERMVESGLKVEQVIIESSESEHLANNQERQNRNEKEELRRQFVKSFGRIAAKEEFDISMNDVAYYNNNPFVGYTKAGSKVNV